MSDKIIMPRSLTAENNAKAIFIGEFFETITLACIECLECDEPEECPVCHGAGEYERQIPVSWTTIKEIYKKAVDNFGEER